MRQKIIAIFISTLGLLISSLLGLTACSVYPGRVPAIVNATDSVRELVRTTDGPLSGASSPRGRAFLGIPYAQAPVGPLRWRPPQPVVFWTAVRDATRTGSPCTQSIGLNVANGGGGGLVIGGEDCLYLNVYGPPATKKRPAAPLPVMVFLPGGAFILGAGDNYDPSRLARTENILVVTANYRLGSFGFLAHPALRRESSGRGSGNFGLLDQQAALRWVQRNAKAFGGDPRNVTLFGESAGAWSACYQAISPSAKGLFKRVILESGSCTDMQSLVSADEAEKGGIAFSTNLNCTDVTDVLDCLRRLPTSRVARAPATRRGIAGSKSWGPVWGDADFPHKPIEAFSAGRFNIVPAIIGSNLNEGRLFSLLIRSDASYRRHLQEDFGVSAARVMARYPVQAFGSPGLAYAAVMTDSRFACPSDDLRRAWASHASVFGYEFADPAPPFRLPRILTGYPVGAYHASELSYVFGTPWALADPMRFTTNQKVLSERIMSAWGRFARGDPPLPGWPITTKAAPNVLQLLPEGDHTVIDFRDRHACEFWKGIQTRSGNARHRTG
ncbi:carboxylesterase/lipase family protein [Agrobacterium rosae]|uniref:Carboxylic ester hydrolase n=1 Tax=Agrobacterium rosae TaxID=1972867 RepID=A0AAW9FK10_9HYPH|nr:carboxylesterase family protein [Agrobacterium rosae]MDX8305764.1 carboxylesterase family protein [Agrobacterium rosae]